MRRRLLAPAALLAAAALVATAPTVANAATVTASNTEFAEIDSSSVTRPLVVDSDATVADVTITIDLDKVSGTCAAPDGGTEFANEIGLVLASPTGTTATLVLASGDEDGTYEAAGQQPRVSLTFDDDAPAVVGSTNGGTLEAGTFRPVEPLSVFDGEAAGGTWQLTVIDSVGADPLCFFGATLVIDDGAPVLEGATLPTALIDTTYSATVEAAGATPITYAAVDADALPAGLTLASDGTLSGTPTEHGEFTFDVVASNATGSSEPATFALTVQAAPTIEGAATAIARIGVPFSYVPVVDSGTPTSSFGVFGLPDGLAVNPGTGEIWGVPTGALGDFVGTYAATSDVEPAPEHTVVISVVAGPVASIDLTPEDATVAEGGTLDLTVIGADIEGNAVDVAATTTLTSDVATDVVDGLSVTFPTASPHVITATDSASGLTDAVTVEVVAAPAPSASAPPVAGPSLPETGAQPAWLLALAALVLVAAGAVVAVRRRA